MERKVLMMLARRADEQAPGAFDCDRDKCPRSLIIWAVQLSPRKMKYTKEAMRSPTRATDSKGRRTAHPKHREHVLRKRAPS